MAPDPADDSAADLPPREVLVVEDNPVNRAVIVALLQRAGVPATAVEHGGLALERLAARRWRLVLMDCLMPEIDGFEATLRWRGIEAREGLPRTPVIALTGNAAEADRLRCHEAGMDDLLAKPVDRATLDAVLARWSPGGTPGDAA